MMRTLLGPARQQRRCRSMMMLRLLVLGGFAGLQLQLAAAEHCVGGACWPGREACVHADPDRPPVQPTFHLMDSSCGENDPNGIFFDPVHGVLHFFHQKHIAAPFDQTPMGPDQHGLAVWGHFASRDGVHWAQLPAAVWNGLEVLNATRGANGTYPTRPTDYDRVSIYTGSATLVPGLAPDGASPGVLMVYPGLCKHADVPGGCSHGLLLAAAVPADYANDPLLRVWKKPMYNPILTDTPNIHLGRFASTPHHSSFYSDLSDRLSVAWFQGATRQQRGTQTRGSVRTHAIF